jgi:DNA repair protein RecN (Recombination protein N)
MLRELRISNVAVIDALQVSFEAGMNVLTGETGAGKSIIMRAIGLLCGERATADLIRTDCEDAAIEGVFDLDEAERGLLDDSGVPPADAVLIRRVITRAGKGRVWVNGNPSTAAVLSQLGARLIHVYGQHEHALLLKPESHLEFVDDFGGLAPQRREMAAAYATLREAAERLATLTAGGEAARQRLELLRFQVHELRDAKLARGDEAQLQQDRERQRHAEKLGLICRQSDEALYSGDQAIAAVLSRIVSQVHDAARIEPGFGPHAEALRQAAVHIEEVALDLRRAAEHIRHDPERLEQIEDRLALLARLKRKYGCDADELVDRLTVLEAELGTLEGAGIDITAARQATVEQAARAWEVARALSRTRQTVAQELERRMTAELASLGMRGAVFRVTFVVAASDGPQPGTADPATAGLSALGGDSVQFHFSANPGEEPKPLARIASGGELSRIMLALKTLTAGAGEVPTLIFDEVDAGIGGAVAEAVGKRLQILGRSRQVLCITHLPQIAAQAAHHFAVEKRVLKGRTTTTARALQPDDRVREITRMLGGASTPESQQYARRLMAGVEKTGRQ